VGLKRRRYIMRSIKRPTNPIAVPLSVAIVIVLGLAIFTPIAQAEQPFDITLCGSTTVTAILVESEELRITTFEGKGVAHYTGRKATMYGHTKFMDPDGDIVVQENSSPFGATGGTWKFIYGTGKWKGIKGSGKALRVATGKRITPDTLQSCIRMTGTFELPK
jgi:hypothetical protein